MKREKRKRGKCYLCQRITTQTAQIYPDCLGPVFLCKRCTSEMPRLNEGESHEQATNR